MSDSSESTGNGIDAGDTQRGIGDDGNGLVVFANACDENRLTYALS